MKWLILIAMGIIAPGVAAGGASAEDAMAQRDFLRIMSTIANVESAIGDIRQGTRALDVRLVALDGLFIGENERELVGALTSQRGTAQVYALRAVIAEHQKLTAALQTLGVNYRNIVAIEVGETGRITIYTFGASA